MTNDGRWNYTWDGENRLIGMQVRAAGTPVTILNFEYDYQGRRIRKTVHSVVSGMTNLTADTKYLYDGWNLMAEISATNNSVVRGFIWGIDLSGSLQGGGGVGGLLWENQGAGNPIDFVSFDGNGNASAIIDATSGIITNRFEYGPFGELLRGDTKTYRFGFSTKYTDNENDFYYYGLRYYNPSSGKWLSKDPIEEAGDINLYEFADNDPIQAIDTDGLETKSSRDDYWKMWSKCHPNRNHDTDSMREKTLDLGCIGVTCLNLGTPNRPDLSNCFKKRAQAEIRQKEMIKKRICKGVNCDKKAAEPRLFSVHLWNDKGKNKKSPDVSFDDTSGKADLGNWDETGRPPGPWKSSGGGGFNFDYGFVNDDGTIEHANHYNNPPSYPMTVCNSSYSEWHRSNSDFNTEVWCVACNNDRFKKK